MPHAVNDGVRIYYELQGDGSPLVLMHGMSENITRWRFAGIAEALQDRHLLIMIDARGHGRSDKPHEPAAYEADLRAGDVVAVLDRVGVPTTHYFGHSLGGWLGIAMAKYAPERLRSLAIGGAHAYGHNLSLLLEALSGDLADWMEFLQRHVGSLSPVERHELLANDIQALRASVAKDRPDVSDVFPRLNVPCLLFAGTADPLRPMVERLARDIPDARFVSVRGNHFEVAVHPELIFPELIPFLVRVDASQASRGPSRTSTA